MGISQKRKVLNLRRYFIPGDRMLAAESSESCQNTGAREQLDE